MLGWPRIQRKGALALVGLTALTLASCSDFGSLPKHLLPLPTATRNLLDKKGMEQTAPILLRIFKDESVLEVWKKQKATSKYALLKSYDICKWSGDLGPKKAEGDRQAPEGFYTITPAQMNPNSDYHLAFNLGYPNAYDQSLGRTGTHLMVHGACSSRGCYSMNDENIQEIYTLARLAFQGGQRDFQVQAFPFRMTPENMAKHRRDNDMAFWRMLKEGYDHFEVIRQPPKVDVCSQRYVFNSIPQDGVSFSPSASCPPLTVPDQVRVAVAEKQAKDEARFVVLAAKLDAKEESAKETDGLADAPPVMIAAAPDVPPAGPMSVASASVDIEPAATGSLSPPRMVSGDVAPAARSPDGDVADVVPNSGQGPAPALPVATAYAPATAPEKRGGIGRIGGWVTGFFR